MQLDINLNIVVPNEVMAILHTLNQRTKAMAMKQAEAVDALKALTAKVNKVGEETGKTLEKVNALTALVEELKAKGEEVSPEMEAAIAEAQAAAQAADDLTPDAEDPLPIPDVEGSPTEPTVPGGPTGEAPPEGEPTEPTTPVGNAPV